eukprot:scaffold681822_cov102-Prasinocladus_malaysianus.AAC.1
MKAMLWGHQQQALAAMHLKACIAISVPCSVNVLTCSLKADRGIVSSDLINSILPYMIVL